jgi:hypothetical protein
MRRGADTQCPRLFPQRMHKTASKYPHVVYVDSFAAPRQSANKDLKTPRLALP